MIAENHGVPLQMIAIMLWKDVMIKQILTDEGKAPNELIATAKKFREQRYLRHRQQKHIYPTRKANFHAA